MMGWGFTSCKDDELEPVVPVLEANGEATAWNTAKFTVSTSSITEYAWMVLPSSETVPSDAVLYKSGNVVTVSEDGTATYELDNLSRLTEYTVYIAAKYVDEHQVEQAYPEMVTVEFTTLDYTDDITVTKVKMDGFDAHIKVPEKVKKGESVLKWVYRTLLCTTATRTV